MNYNHLGINLGGTKIMGLKKQDHYIKCGHTEYIFNAEYYDNNDAMTITVKQIKNNEIITMELNDPAVRSILSIYQNLKFGGK